MTTETRQYKDVSGNPCTLDWLVKNEPEWAANQIRHRDKIEHELNETKEQLAATEIRRSNAVRAYLALQAETVAAMPNEKVQI